MKKLSRVIALISALWVLVLVIYAITFRFRFPDMAETRLMLSLWWVVPASLPSVVGVAWWVKIDG